MAQLIREMALQVKTITSAKYTETLFQMKIKKSTLVILYSYNDDNN